MPVGLLLSLDHIYCGQLSTAKHCVHALFSSNSLSLSIPSFPAGLCSVGVATNKKN